MAEEFWIVGKNTGTEFVCTAWEFQGVFSTESGAVAACRDSNYFIGPATIDTQIGDKPTEWPGAYYPIPANNRDEEI